MVRGGFIEVACAIIIHKGRVLITQRSEVMPHPLKWEFPGGKLKTGETPEYCIRREIREELGIEIKVEQLLPAVKHTYDTHKIKLIPFICSIHEGAILLSEHKSYRWVKVNELDTADWVDADRMVTRIFRERWGY